MAYRRRGGGRSRSRGRRHSRTSRSYTISRGGIRM